MSTAAEIAMVCEDIKTLLLTKNCKYGDSALSPVRIFSRCTTDEQLKVRIDDKLSRIASNPADEDEDVIQDLVGYLVLLLIHKRRHCP